MSLDPPHSGHCARAEAINSGFPECLAGGAILVESIAMSVQSECARTV